MWLRVVDAYYTVEDDGYRQTMPVLHLFGRDTQWQRHHVRIDSARPYFCVTQQEWAQKGEDVTQDDRVLSIETEDLRGRPETAIDGTPLVRVVCREPTDVGDLQSLFDDPYEADVKFPVRFLVDFDIFQWVNVPDEHIESGETIPADELELDVDDSETPDQVPPPRVCTYDIEVKQGGRGPPVVSEDGTEQARNPITAITAHDSYTDEYTVWLLAHNDWGVADSQAARDAVDAEVSVYKNPKTVVSMFCEYVTERDFDILTAWSGSGFDHPYLVNYAINNDINGVYELSPTRDVYSMSGDGSWINGQLKGRLLLDSLTLYKKCQIHQLDSYRLSDVAKEEDVDTGKLSITDEIDVPEGQPAIDYAWKEHPDIFSKYSVRDVKACVQINTQSQSEVNII